MKLIKFNSKGIFLLILLTITMSQVYSNDRQEPDCDPCKLEVALNSLSEHYSVLFSYKTNLVKDVEVSFEINEDEDFDDALNRLLTGLELKYKSIDSKYYLLYTESSEDARNIRRMERKIKSLRSLERETGIRLFRRNDDNKSVLKKIYKNAQIHFNDITVEGSVVNTENEPLIGVNVLVKGKNVGTTTDFDGKFTLEGIEDGDILVVSYIGYVAQEIVAEEGTVLNIVLEESAETLDEVVVTGYTQQIKRKVTSSVATVKTAELSDIPATSLGNAIAGRVAGVAITQDGGRPGRTSSINVRGATVKGFNGSSTPLYVIDGIVATKDLFDALDVSEVESVTALKDASATAQYGARASNGVILVQTKKGNGKPVINFTSTYGITEPTLTPEFTTPYEHGLLINSYLTFLNTDPLDSRYITQKELDFLKNVDYGSYVGQFAQNPVLFRNAVSIGGSNETVNYFMAGSKINQTAEFDNLTYDKYNIRAKLDVNLSERIKVGMNISTSRYQDEGFYWRYNGSDENYGDFYRTSIRQGRWAPAVKNGLYVANFNGWNGANIINNGAGKQNRNNNITNILLTGSYKLPFIKGLTFSSVYNKNTTTHERKLFRTPLVSYTFATDPDNRFLLTDQVIGTRVRRDNGADSDSVLEGEQQTENYQLNFKLDYQNTFDDHTISVYSVYEQSEQDYKWFEGIGRGVTTELVQTFDGTTQGEQRTRGGLSETGRQSVIGGINYDFRGKYLLSTSFRYDGSVQFEKENRFGLFPSVSIGWIASDEPFIKNTLPFLDYLKFRYSVGKTGNDNIETDDFVYIQKYNIGTGAVFGTDEQITSSTVLGGLPVLGTTWESQTSNNFGLDFNLLRDRLQTSVDIFKSEKRNLFGTRQSFIPESSGLALLPENYGGIDISGFEILTSYRDHIGRDFTFEAGFNFGYAKSKYVNIDQPESTLPHLVLNDQFTDRVRTFVSEGIIRTQEQLDALPDNFTQFGRAPELGELLIRDIRGNAQEDPGGNTPDGKVDNNDLDYIEGSHSSPPINYGMRIAVKFKNFSLQAFAQGFAGHQRVFPQAARFTLAEAGESAWSIWNDSWAPNNPDASFPVYGGDQIYQYRESTFFMEDADFLRLKQLNLAYDTPERLLNVINVRSLRFFVNMDNLLMISRKIKVFDPETNGRGLPVNRSYSVGINLTF